MARPAKPMRPAPSSIEECQDGALSIEGCASFCSLSRREIEDALAAGEIETFNRGRRVLITRREAARWLACLLEASRAKRGAGART